MAGLFDGMVEIVLGPQDHKVKLRRLSSGTPYTQESAEECCFRMLEIADEHSAQPDIFAKESDLRVKPDGFTSDQMREYIAASSNEDGSSNLVYKITQGKFGPGMCIFKQEESYEVQGPKTLVF